MEEETAKKVKKMFLLKSLKMVEKGATDKIEEEISAFQSHINLGEKLNQRQQKLDLYCGVCFLGEQIPTGPDESKLNPLIKCDKK